MSLPFVHKLGVEAQSRCTKIKGIIISRCECLYGCNRYAIQPPVGADNKLPDSIWLDEDDLEITGDGVSASLKEKRTGGPISRGAFP
jgi:hypothetical protein